MSGIEGVGYPKLKFNRRLSGVESVGYPKLKFNRRLSGVEGVGYPKAIATTKASVIRSYKLIFFRIFKYMTGYMYILKCSNDSYYTGSTIDLYRRLDQHQNGEGANHTKKFLPVELVYWEEYDRIDTAFYREKQIQGWSRKKKEALINGTVELLPNLSKCIIGSHFSLFKP